MFIVDDEAPARNRIRDLLQDCAASLPIQLAGEAANGLDLMGLIQDTPADVILLDIRMPEMDGIEAAQHLLRLPDPPSIIFTTAYDDYALKAFELHAIDYLVKPIRLRRLHEALMRVRALTPLRLDVLQKVAPEARTHLSAQERGRVILIPIAEVLFLRAELKYVTVRTAHGEHLIEESLSRLEEEFGERFVRIHRSCLVAKAYVGGFEREAGEGEARWVVLLRGIDERLPVSRRQQHIVRELGRITI